MALIGYTNKLIESIYIEILKNEDIAKLLYYNKELDIDINELPTVKNPVGELKTKVFKNRRLEKLQRKSDVGISISLYNKSDWKELGKTYKKTIENVVEIGIICHIDIDDMLNGSRVYALMDLVMNAFEKNSVHGLGQLDFLNTYKTKDLNNEYIGYQMYFSIFNIKEEM